MLDTRVAFDSPLYLGLLVLLPALWWLSYRSLSGLGRARRAAALGLRSVVLLLIILALADTQRVWTLDRLTVIYLLDQSLSVPDEQRREAVDYINQSIARHRDHEKQDRAGVVVFGQDAAVEIPPIDDNVPVPLTSEIQLDEQHTNLAQALKMALALFPHDSAKRVVVISDGNQTIGDAQAQAQALADAGVSIDVLPLHLQARGEVAVEKLTVSSDVRRGQAFDLRVVLNNTTEPKPGERGVVKGKLKIVRRAGEREVTMAEDAVELPPGKRVFTIRQEIDQPDFYTYEARFVPDNPADDAMVQNNVATTFTQIRGRGHVLVIEDWTKPGQFDFFIERLRRENLEVTLMPSNQLFNNLSELQRYDTVVLADVPRSSGDDADDIANFTDAQIAMLTRNTQQMGSGLVMLGGPSSFGAGGWTNTELEKAMPVDFQIKSAKVAPVGALAMLMHASEMPEGNHWQKVVAREALKALGPQDYCGVLHWDGNDRWLWRHPSGFAKVGPLRQQMLARLDKMMPGDMPQFDPAMVMAAGAFAKLPDAAVKHMIIISDGDPSPPQNATLLALKNGGVKVTTVAIGSHGTLGSTPMQQIAKVTGGKYYVVRDARALPRIYQREARRISRPLVYEDKNGLAPRLKYPHEMLKGLEGPIPPITGFVMTTVKDSPLVEVSLVSPQPPGDENATLLASWTYGLGKTVAFTTDTGQRWASQWTSWENYDKLFGQMIRWSMRPVADTGQFALATSAEEGQGNVVITALDKDDEFLNFLSMTGTVVGPDMEPQEIRIRQVAPGRYVGDFDAKQSGSYFVMVSPGAGQAPIRAGVNVAYSAEFRDHESNLPLLKTLASLKPKDGAAGEVIDAPQRRDLEPLLAFNPFRRDLPKSTASQDIWPFLVFLAACLFLADVANRRVQLDLSWLAPALGRLRDKVLRRDAAPVVSETMSRLKGSKAAVSDELEEKRRATRFEPTPDAPIDPTALQTNAPPPRPTQPQPSTQQMTPQKEEVTYTERLLKAKRQAREKGRGEE